MNNHSPLTDVKLLAIDLDHTLIGFGLQPISVVNQQMILAAQKKLMVVIVTGRSFERSLHYAEQLKLRYHICFGGALTYDLHTRRFVKIQTIEPAVLEQIAKLVSADSRLFAVFYGLDEQRQQINNFALNQPNAGFLLHQIDQSSFKPFQSQVFQTKIVRVNIFTQSEITLAKTLRRLNQYTTLKVNKNYQTVLEITAHDGHKGVAFAALCAMLGVTADQTMAIVDSLNDQSLVEFVKYGVAVANAHPTIKRLCRLQTAAYDQNGVGQAIQKWLLTVNS